MSETKPKHFDDPFADSSLFKKLVTVSVILTFISTFFGLDRSLTTVADRLNYYDLTDDDQSYWEDWKTVIIIYYMGVLVVSIIGFVGLVYDKDKLLVIFCVFTAFFFIFGFVNEALRQNVFGAVVQLPAVLITGGYVYWLRTSARVQPRRKRISVWTVNEQNMRADVI